MTSTAPARPRSEAEEQATGLIWDEEGNRWINEDEASSERTACEAGVPGQEKGAAKAEHTNSDVIWMEWKQDDPENPYNWSRRKKWITTWISCIFTLVVAFAGSAFSMGTDSMKKDLNCSSELAVLGLSAFPLGFGLAPLVLAPFSEAYGRWPMYVCSSAVYCIFYLPITLGNNIATVIVARLIGGLAASTGSTLVGGTVADLFVTSERGLPMSIFSLCAFAGTGLGPAVMGYVEEYLRWRWISWIQMIMAGAVFLAIILFTRETRGSVILSRRAAKLRKETGNPCYQCRSDAERASLAVLVKVSMTRPIYLLFTEAIVAAFSLWVGVAWGVLLRAVPLVFRDDYGFSIGQIGLVFFSVVAASVVGYFGNLYQEKLYQKHSPKRGPEARLYMSMFGGLIFPIGLFIFAFSAGRGHWIGPVIGLFLAFYGIFTIYLCTFNYLADSYTIYASSALSGQSLCRNLAGFAFPLFTSSMYAGMGYQWASFLAGMLALGLSVTPFVLYAYGPKIRARSGFAKELARMREGQ